MPPEGGTPTAGLAKGRNCSFVERMIAGVPRLRGV
jgi:hypothetical protein